jgi:hypothetical protein
MNSFLLTKKLPIEINYSGSRNTTRLAAYPLAAVAILSFARRHLDATHSVWMVAKIVLTSGRT